MRRNVCIVTSYNKNYKEVAELTMPNIIKYCNKHSIDFYKSEKQFVEDKYIAWNKLILIKQILSLYDWIFYIDTDCLVVNSNKKIEDLIDDQYSIIIGENYSPDDWYKDSKTNLEMGTIFFKNSPITFEILNDMCKPPYDLTHPWQDQFQFMKLLWENKMWDESVKKIDAKLINTIGKYFRTPEETFIYHCAGGYNPNHKLEMLKNILPICF
jgi:mannan polymerase II complex MNN10 subunit